MIPKLAICSPSRNTYSETFIQAHKQIPGVETKFYYGGGLPEKLEGYGPLKSMGRFREIGKSIKLNFFPSPFSDDEQALIQSFKREKINCVLAEYGPTGVKLLNVCKHLNLPLIVHFHGYDASIDLIIEKNKKGYEALFSYACSVIVVSKAMERKLTFLGCSPEKLVYNTYGPDDTFFDVSPDFRKKLLVGIGRFVDKKAPYYTILAFKEVLEKHPDAQLVIGGDGILFNTCLNLIDYLGIKDKVVLPGIIQSDQFRMYLQEARGFVQHSVTAENGDMEGTPVAVLEASAAGLPVISTYHAGIPDVIIHEQTGLLTEEHNVQEMALHMMKILDDAAYARQLGAAGRSNIRNNFSMKRHLDILSEIAIHCSRKKSAL
jgi:colanic acid/amylovoran biosynthesis glycosyltransferase